MKTPWTIRDNQRVILNLTTVGINRWEFQLCFTTRKSCKKYIDIWAAVNNDVCGHSWVDSPIIFTRDCVTHDNYWRITPLVTTNIVINESPYIILYCIWFSNIFHWLIFSPLHVRLSLGKCYGLHWGYIDIASGNGLMLPDLNKC